MTDTPKTVSRSSFAFLSGTFLSRLTGLVRDTSMAAAFGSSPAIAAFMVAFRLANLVRRLFGEGALSSGFIPHFEQIRGASPEQGAKFARDLMFSLSFFLIVLIAVAEVVLWGIWKWGNLLPDNAQILRLTMWMLPGVLFICLFGLSSALLQCERRFFLTGIAPAAFNGVWIAAALMLHGVEPEVAVFPLAGAITAAFLMQWAMLAPQSFALLRRSLSWKEVLKPNLFSPELKNVIRPLLLGIAGTGAVQINSALDAIFARCASLEGPAYLWYAIRIEQLPLAMFGIALSAALLPPLSRALKNDAKEAYLKLLRFAFRRSFSLIFPCTLGIFVLGLASINLLYGHGDFTGHDVYQTALCLWGYGLGLLPSVFVLLLAPGFYAQKEYRIPMIGSVLSVALHLVMTTAFVFGLGWGAFSIAIATSVAAWFNFFFLFIALSKRMGERLLDAPAFRSFLKGGACTAFAALAALMAGQFIISDTTARGFSTQALQLLGLGGTFALVLLSCAWMMNAEDILELVRIKKAAREELL